MVVTGSVFTVRKTSYYRIESPPARTTFLPSLSLKCSDFRFSVTNLIPIIVLPVLDDIATSHPGIRFTTGI